MSAESTKSSRIAATDWMEFLFVRKYPPSLSYTAVDFIQRFSYLTPLMKGATTAGLRTGDFNPISLCSCQAYPSASPCRLLRALRVIRDVRLNKK